MSRTPLECFVGENSGVATVAEAAAYVGDCVRISVLFGKAEEAAQRACLAAHYAHLLIELRRANECKSQPVETSATDKGPKK